MYSFYCYLCYCHWIATCLFVSGYVPVAVETGARGEWPLSFVVRTGGQTLRAAANEVFVAACEARAAAAAAASTTTTTTTTTYPPTGCRCPAPAPCPACPACAATSRWTGGDDDSSSSSNTDLLEEEWAGGLLDGPGEAGVALASALAGWGVAYAWPLLRDWADKRSRDNVSHSCLTSIFIQWCCASQFSKRHCCN